MSPDPTINILTRVAPLAGDEEAPEGALDTSAAALYFRGLDLIAEGRPSEAAALLRESVALDPLFLDALHALTRALQDAGHLDEAVLITHRLIMLDPDDVLAHTRLSILYQTKGMVPEAEAESIRAKLLGWKRQLRESNAEAASAKTAGLKADGDLVTDPSISPRDK